MIGLQLTVIVGLATLTLGFGGGLSLGRMQGDQKISKLQSAYTIEKANAAVQSQRAERAARDEEQRQVTKFAELANAAHKQANDARTDAQRADHAASELRRAYLIVASTISKGGSSTNSPATSGSPTTSGTGLVLSNLFSRGDQILRQCAAALDQSRVAGQTCERSYDSLMSNCNVSQNYNAPTSSVPLYLTKSGG